jgi:peptidyl-prolyl cis-trans isomerase A (cyclophilin A)
VIITTNQGDIHLRLDAEMSPETVDNFLVNYVSRDFYNATIFHYVESEFIVAAGGFTADLLNKETRAPIRNEADNGLKNLRGTVAMSRDSEYADSATSQFFINLADNDGLDHDPEQEGANGYCVFGEVVAGIEVVEQIASLPAQNVGDFQNVPVSAVVIQSVKRVK